MTSKQVTEFMEDVGGHQATARSVEVFGVTNADPASMPGVFVVGVRAFALAVGLTRRPGVTVNAATNRDTADRLPFTIARVSK